VELLGINLKKDISFLNQTLPYSWLGLKLTYMQDGVAEGELKAEEHHRGGGGTEAINGGVIGYIADFIMGTAVISTWDEHTSSNVTVSITVNYEKMVTGDMVYAKGWVTKRGGSMAFTQLELKDEKGEVCVRATGVYRLFRQK